MQQITLTDDQQKVNDAFSQFILKPDEKVMVITGYAGTGKSTLTGYLISHLPKLLKTVKAIDPNAEDWEIAVTATTNKAAEALSFLLHDHVVTIHSFLGLRVQTDYTDQSTSLVSTSMMGEIALKVSAPQVFQVFPC